MSIGRLTPHRDHCPQKIGATTGSLVYISSGVLLAQSRFGGDVGFYRVRLLVHIRIAQGWVRLR